MHSHLYLRAVVLTIAALASTHRVLSLNLLPDIAHCSSYASIPKKDGQWAVHHVEEFIDTKRQRSTIVIGGQNVLEKIYYNEYTVGDSRMTERRLVVFDQKNGRCKSENLATWPLSTLRWLSLQMMPSMTDVPGNIEQAIGPSSLLVAVEQNLSGFKFKGRDFSTTRLTFLDIYVLRLGEDESNGRLSDMFVRLEVFRNHVNGPKVDVSLAEAADRNPNIDVASLVVCKIDSGAALPGDNNCNKEDILAYVEYVSVAPFRSRSLVGSALQNSKPYFYEAPFLPPIAIGCYDSSSTFAALKQFSAPAPQFSAEYTTTNGTSGLAYVAYDGRNSLVRLDRFGRKSIHDLESGYSYYEAEIRSDSDAINSTSRRGTSCVVMHDAPGPFDQKETVLERLLGVGSEGESPAHYLGTRMIDHLSYDVYEAELLFNQPTQGRYSLPVIMEPVAYEMPSISTRAVTRFFMTYYVVEFKAKLSGDGSTQIVKEPKFIELWKYNIATKSKTLINRLTFTKFSWGLDVVPSDSSDDNMSELFHLDSCKETRSPQTQLKFGMIQNESKVGFEVLDANVGAIKTEVARDLSQLLEIPRLSISHVQVMPRRAGNIWAQVRVSNLMVGTEYNNYLGSSNMADIFKSTDTVLEILRNRHYISECRLDSIQHPKPNLIVHCREVAICLLLNQDPETRKLFVPETSRDQASGPLTFRDTFNCQAYEYDWAPKPPQIYDGSLARIGPEMSVQHVIENQYKINRYRPKFMLQYRDEKDRKWYAYNFSGSALGPELKNLNSDGFLSMVDSKSALVGLRYTTQSESPNTFNMNEEVRLVDTIDSFSHCQRACQLEDYCSSFSYCSRADGRIGQSDCILSSMRLSAKKSRQIARDLTNLKGQDLAFVIDSQFITQTIRLVRDERCTLHKKDMVSSFRAMPLDSILVGKVENPKLPQEGNDGRKTKPVRRTLEDCAEESHELTLETSSNAYNTSFVYCALDSLCWPIAGNFELDQSTDSQVKSYDSCHVYRKHHAQYYSEVPLSRTLIKRGKDGSARPSLAYQGLSVEECARDCSLLNSKCLSFDSCSFIPGVTVCIIFSIRSPIAGISARLPLLPIESQYYATGGDELVKLAPGPQCQHYSMKEQFLEVRIQQLMDLASKTDRNSKINEEEDKILETDREKSGDLAEMKPDPEFNSRREETPTGGFTNWFLLFTGVFLGVLGVQYGREMTLFLINFYHIKRDQRHANQALRGLVLTDNMEV